MYLAMTAYFNRSQKVSKIKAFLLLTESLPISSIPTSRFRSMLKLCSGYNLKPFPGRLCRGPENLEDQYYHHRGFAYDQIYQWSPWWQSQPYNNDQLKWKLLMYDSFPTYSNMDIILFLRCFGDDIKICRDSSRCCWGDEFNDQFSNRSFITSVYPTEGIS